MELDSSKKVALPGQGIVKYKSGDVIYVYYITPKYRSANSKPMSINNVSFTNILEEHRKIKYVNTKDGRKLLSTITKKQRDILDTCGLFTDDLSTWLSSISV